MASYTSAKDVDSQVHILGENRTGMEIDDYANDILELGSLGNETIGSDDEVIEDMKDDAQNEQTGENAAGGENAVGGENAGGDGLDAHRPKRRKKSKVWKSFTETEVVEGSVKVMKLECSHCGQKLKCYASGCTTSMNRHLEKCPSLKKK